MPFPHEHSARIISPDKFEKDSFKSKGIAPGIRIIVGKLKGRDSMTTQTYRFDSSKLTVDEAKSWLKRHNIKNISFATALKLEKAKYLSKKPDGKGGWIYKYKENNNINSSVIKKINEMDSEEDGNKSVQISFIESFFDVSPKSFKKIAESQGYTVEIDKKNDEIKLLKSLKKAKSSLKDKVIKYLTKHPAPEDESEFHKFAETVADEHDIAEETAYEILGELLAGGKSKGKKNKVNPKELAMGIKIELEHTKDKQIAEKIARDHLFEISDYYSRLKKMESEADKPMKKAYLHVAGNLYVKLEKAKGTHKYYKRVPKAGGGYIYYYSEGKEKSSTTEEKPEETKPKEEKKPEEKPKLDEKNKGTIRNALKKVANILAEALSGKDTVSPTGSAIEQAGESANAAKPKPKPKKTEKPDKKENKK